jgi:hypothetical protein
MDRAGDVSDPRVLVRHSGSLGLTGKPGGVSDGGRPYIVMPYHSQDSLDVRIRRHGPLPSPTATRN